MIVVIVFPFVADRWSVFVGYCIVDFNFNLRIKTLTQLISLIRLVSETMWDKAFDFSSKQISLLGV